MFHGHLTGPASFSKAASYVPTPKPSAPTGAPMYGDIWNYLDPGTEGAKAWLTQGATDPSEGSYIQDKDGNMNFVPAQKWTVDQSKIPEKYRGLIQGYRSTTVGSNMDTQYDWSKIGGGGTVFGNDVNSTINQMRSLGTDPNKPPTLYMKSHGREQDDEAVKDKSQVKWDPKFGWITPKMNVIHPVPEKTSAIDYAGMALGAAMGGGLLGAVSPAMGLGMAGMNALHGLGSGANWKQTLLSMAPSLIGMGMGASGISFPKLPPELAQAMKYAQYAKTGYGIYNAMNRGK